MTLKTRITDDMKTAMKAKDSVRLGAKQHGVFHIKSILHISCRMVFWEV